MEDQSIIIVVKVSSSSSKPGILWKLILWKLIYKKGMDNREMGVGWGERDSSRWSHVESSITGTYGWSRGCLREVVRSEELLWRALYCFKWRGSVILLPLSTLLGEEGKLRWLIPYRMTGWSWKPEVSKGFMELPEKNYLGDKTSVAWNVFTYLIDRLYSNSHSKINFSFQNLKAYCTISLSSVDVVYHISQFCG